MTIAELLSEIQPISAEAEKLARAHWSRVAKPLGSLGQLEEMVVRMAGITGKECPDVRKKAVIVFCADNGVVAEGVTQCGQEVTASVAVNLARGISSVCQMAAIAGAEVIPVDVGMISEQNMPNLQQYSVMKGTNNFTIAPAMSRAQAEAAILTGAAFAKELQESGCGLLAAGEMGIGNTTTSSAVVSVLLDVEPKRVTGRGAGLTTEGLLRKISAIERGISYNQPQKSDPIDVIAKVGGLDIAAMTGFYLGCARCRVPVILDGFISCAAALAAVRMCPSVKDYLLPSHCSEEPAARMVLDALGFKSVIQAGMRLGEGTGAVALMPLLDMTLAVYTGVPTFEQMEIEAYVELK